VQQHSVIYLGNVDDNYVVEEVDDSVYQYQ